MHKVEDVINAIADEIKAEIGSEIDIPQIQRKFNEKLKNYEFSVKCTKCGKRGFRKEARLIKKT